MRFHQSLATGMAAICFFVGAFCVQAQDSVRWKDGGYVCESKFTWDAKPGGSIEVVVNSMNVSVSGSSDNKVILEEKIILRAQDSIEAMTYFKSKVNLEQSGNVFRLISPNTPKQFEGGSLRFQVPENFGVKVTTSGGDLEANHIKGSIELVTSGGDVRVMTVSGTIDLITSGGDISGKDVDGTFNANTSGGDIDILRAGPIINANTMGGDIQFEEVKGTVSGATSAGDITLIDLDGGGSLSTSGGDIEISKVRGGKSVSASTSGGDIEVQDSEADMALSTSSGDIGIMRLTGSVNAVTSNGDIHGDNIQGPILRASTSNGDMMMNDVSGALSIATSSGDIKARVAKSLQPFAINMVNSDGDILCQLPKKYQGTVEAKIKHWSEDESADIQTDFPLNISTEGKSSRVARGDINGGGPAIHLETSDGGGIRIEKY